MKCLKPLGYSDHELLTALLTELLTELLTALLTELLTALLTEPEPEAHFPCRIRGDLLR